MKTTLAPTWFLTANETVPHGRRTSHTLQSASPLVQSHAATSRPQSNSQSVLATSSRLQKTANPHLTRGKSEKHHKNQFSLFQNSIPTRFTH
ncbi:hypothetical protein Sjap_018177 [Stephania japonica]|uniref:Uncharacterized protein n=1 Tax=Stephania japonica TaxID=461633 RepID=A0AAP0I7I1_9MAGN